MKLKKEVNPIERGRSFTSWHTMWVRKCSRTPHTRTLSLHSGKISCAVQCTAAAASSPVKALRVSKSWPTAVLSESSVVVRRRRRTRQQREAMRLYLLILSTRRCYMWPSNDRGFADLLVPRTWCVQIHFRMGVQTVRHRHIGRFKSLCMHTRFQIVRK